MLQHKIYERLKKGDEAALAEIMNKYAKTAFISAAKVLATPEDCEEIAADVFVKLWQNPDLYSPEKSDLKTFVYTCAKNAALDLLRRRKSTVEIPDIFAAKENTEDDFLAEQAAEERRAKIRAAEENLTDREKEIIEARFIDDAKPAEIAKRLGEDVRKVENTIYRAKNKMRKALGDVYEIQ